MSITPESIYNSYRRLLKKGDFERAYRSLEKLLVRLPEEEGLVEEMITLCLNLWKRPDLARPWLLKIADKRVRWRDYLALSTVEAELGYIPDAKQNLKKAIEIQLNQPVPKKAEMKKIEDAFIHAERYIRSCEQGMAAKQAQKQISPVNLANKAHVRTTETAQPKASGSTVARIKKVEKMPAVQSVGTSRRHVSKTAPGKKAPKVQPKEEVKPAIRNIPSYKCNITFVAPDSEVFTSFQNTSLSNLKALGLLLDYTRLSIQGGFDELLCLNAISGVEHHWYQIESVKKTMKSFHGRVLLCDEVGLGKTIEAGMLIKEYTMRGMARNVLILAPPPLVSQWKEEMSVKFGMDFVTTEDNEFTKRDGTFWKNRHVIASINTAKSGNHKPGVLKEFFDIVVVDEAHHLKNRSTIAWKLVNELNKRFILLLTATPVQNNLLELYNLITLLKPGQFRTERLFKQEYLAKGSTRTPVNREKLQELLRDVMIRNTRSVIDLKLPNRFAATYRLVPDETEKEIYRLLTDFIKSSGCRKPAVNLLLREAGSSPFALKNSLVNMNRDGANAAIKNIIALIDSLDGISKGKRLMEIVNKNRGQKIIVFTQYLKSIDYLADLLGTSGVDFTVFSGDKTAKEKDEAIARFKDDIPVLLSTESGGEGRNIQFCNTIINFDLPWNPMRIEQRIGRLHRIGQTRDVFIFNLSVKGTIEDYMIDILDNKINMFEMVIGEIEPILGYLGKEEDFDEIVLDIWLRSAGDIDVERAFEAFGTELVAAKKAYMKSRKMDEEIFGDDYET